MLRFGGDDKTIFGGITVRGNFGVRVIKTKVSSEGSVGFPDANTFNALPACGTPLTAPAIVNPRCF
jgi:hypothetical protein